MELLPRLVSVKLAGVWYYPIRISWDSVLVIGLHSFCVQRPAPPPRLKKWSILEKRNISERSLGIRWEMQKPIFKTGYNIFMPHRIWNLISIRWFMEMLRGKSLERPFAWWYSIMKETGSVVIVCTLLQWDNWLEQNNYIYIIFILLVFLFFWDGATVKCEPSPP